MGSSGVIWIGHVSVTQLENVWSSSTATTPLVEKTLKKEINIERAVWLRTSNILKRPWHHLNSLPQPPPPSTPASPPVSLSLLLSISVFIYIILVQFKKFHNPKLLGADVCAPSSARAFSTPHLPISSLARIRSPFASGSPLCEY